jgi:hypothetical protein
MSLLLTCIKQPQNSPYCGAEIILVTRIPNYLVPRQLPGLLCQGPSVTEDLILLKIWLMSPCDPLSAVVTKV